MTCHDMSFDNFYMVRSPRSVCFSALALNVYVSFLGFRNDFMMVATITKYPRPRRRLRKKTQSRTKKMKRASISVTIAQSPSGKRIYSMSMSRSTLKLNVLMSVRSVASSSPQKLPLVTIYEANTRKSLM